MTATATDIAQPNRTTVFEPIRRPLGASRPPWLVVTQIFFGLGCLRAASEKAISLDWWTGDTIRAFVTDHQDLTLGWFTPILDQLVVPFAPVVAIGVLLAQLIIGASLVTNRRAGPMLWLAMGLNLAFIGTIHPAEVIDDPAIVMAMFGDLAALAAHLTHRAMFGRNLP